MRAALVRAYGGPDCIQLESDVPIPIVNVKFPILIRVAATTVNPADCKQRSGNLKMVVKHKFPVAFGQDFSGVVEAAPDNSRFKKGDRVYGCTAPRNGCGAELVAVAEDEVAHMPS